jgi:predicted phosphodiesterase
MRLNFIGDVHGEIKLLKQRIEQIPEDELIIQVGDMGAGFVKIPKFPDNVKWIRGNHDDPVLARHHYNYLGDYGFLKDLKLFYLAGAWSIDWAPRKARMNNGGMIEWWEDEELSLQELAEARKLYNEVKPDIVVSHECPSSITYEVLNSGPTSSIIGDYQRAKFDCQWTRTAAALEAMYQDHAPKYWVFGHYHKSITILKKETKFICVGELDRYTIEV